MEWISVKDKLPKTGTPVLVFNGRFETISTPCGFYSLTRWIEEDYQIGDYITLDVTHWMPLPEPPKEG